VSPAIRPASARPRLAVDWTRCDGHGLCAALLPDAISLDEFGYPIFDRRALERETSTNLRRVANTCPALAIRMEK
jgi:ferredoxin